MTFRCAGGPGRAERPRDWDKDRAVWRGGAHRIETMGLPPLVQKYRGWGQRKTMHETQGKSLNFWRLSTD